MSPSRARSTSRGSGRRRGRAVGGVLQLDVARIERALGDRVRYRYVVPRVEPASPGWRIVSPNCSRNVDPDGGEIDIAWFEPVEGGRWLVHARDHAARAWRPHVGARTLAAAVACVCEDPDRVFWP